MTFRRAAALLLCLVMIMTVSCAGRTSDGGDEGGLPDAVGAIDFEAAYGKYGQSDILLQDGELSADWDIVYYYLCRSIEEIYQTTGVMPDLTDTSETGYATQIKTQALERILTGLAIESAASRLGVALTDEDRASMALTQQMAEEQEGGKKEFEAYLEKSHASYQTYLNLLTLDCLYEGAFEATWGENASQFPDERVEEYIAGDGYMMVKHILRTTVQSDGTPLSEDEVESARLDVEAILADLRAYEGDDFDAYFDGKMRENSQDAIGVDMYPDGYLFTSGQAYEELETAAQSLEIGELSEVIKTAMGYHIVYRLPINYDVIPQGYAWEPSNTLRSQAAREAFGLYIEELSNEIGSRATGTFFELDLAEKFT